MCACVCMSASACVFLEASVSCVLPETHAASLKRVSLMMCFERCVSTV